MNDTFAGVKNADRGVGENCIKLEQGLPLRFLHGQLLRNVGACPDISDKTPVRPEPGLAAESNGDATTIRTGDRVVEVAKGPTTSQIIEMALPFFGFTVKFLTRGDLLAGLADEPGWLAAR